MIILEVVAFKCKYFWFLLLCMYVSVFIFKKSPVRLTIICLGLFLLRGPDSIRYKCWPAVPVRDGHVGGYVPGEHGLPPLHHLPLPHPRRFWGLVPAGAQAGNIRNSPLYSSQ